MFFYLLATQFSIGMLFGLAYVVATVTRQPFQPFLGVGFCLIAGLVQWVSGADLLAVGLTLMILILELARIGVPLFWVKRKKTPLTPL